MANRPDPDIDDDFSELYKEYTGPLGSTATNVHDNAKTNKRSHASSSDEEEPRDPNAVPTDFTSREAKVWEAKSKATERNWKKRKEEEMICKICGESGHFTQGCPSTLGANRKSQDFFERVPAREKHVKALFTEKVIQKIEKDIGCKIKLDEKFIIVSGKDRLILAKGVDAVHKVKEEGEKKGSSSSRMSRSKSPERRSPVGSRFGRSDSQRSLPSPRKSSQFQQRFGRQDKVVEDRVREDLQKLARGSPQAYGNDGAGGRSSHSKSPARPLYSGNSYNSFDSRSQGVGAYRTDGWDRERRGCDMQSGRNFDYPASAQTLEESELEYKREAMELERIRDKEEDEENYKHREVIKEMRENYMKKLAILRGKHAKQWEEFLQLDAQRRQQRARQQISSSEFGGYKQPSYPDYDNSAGNAHYAGANIAMDSPNSNLRSSNFASAFIHSRSSPPPLYSQFEGGMAAAQLYVAILLLLGFISTSQLQAVAVEQISHLKLNSKILQESIINLVNGNPRAGWKADMSPRFSNYTVGQFKHLLGVKPTPQHDLKNVPVITHSKTVKLPDQFDARTAWPQCSSIGKILDQGHCGSCWAFGAVESLSDRFCIHFGMNISLSVNDLLACCGFLCGDGCDGGYPLYAWRYFVHHGVVTEECDPYFDNTGCSHPGCEPAYATPKCKRKCVNKNLLWRQSKHFSDSAYRIHSDPNNIMAEVYKNGPVEVSFTVYEDFAHYKSGVYKHMTGDVLGGHAVKLIGWGTTEDGEDYWLLANQWNRSWGDDGYFKIKRGTNECGIEEDVTGGLPSSKNLIKEFANMDATLDVSV